jgi:hypothetical protein
MKDIYKDTILMIIITNLFVLGMYILIIGTITWGLTGGFSMPIYIFRLVAAGGMIIIIIISAANIIIAAIEGR